jgi:hypothetical protein
MNGAGDDGDTDSGGGGGGDDSGSGEGSLFLLLRAAPLVCVFILQLSVAGVARTIYRRRHTAPFPLEPFVALIVTSCRSVTNIRI